MATFYLEYCYAPFRSRYGSDKDASIRPGSPPELSLHLLFMLQFISAFFNFFLSPPGSSGHFLTIFKNGNCAAVCTLDCALLRPFRQNPTFQFFRLIKNSLNYGIIWDIKCRLHLGILFFKSFKIKPIEY